MLTLFVWRIPNVGPSSPTINKAGDELCLVGNATAGLRTSMATAPSFGETDERLPHDGPLPDCIYKMILSNFCGVSAYVVSTESTHSPLNG